ncbi:MAG TPA: hypothetical protein PK737_01390 [Bacilli bacterium]|nr:hypothetical protein [Bacilli bacterium]
MKVNSNLDIWSIQNKAEEILYALDSIENKGKIVLFTNLESSFELGGIEVNKRFDNLLWVKQQIPEETRIEQNGRLIKFMQGAKFSQDTTIGPLLFKKGQVLGINEIKAILAYKNIEYIEFNSAQEPTPPYEYDPNIPEAWTVRFLEVLESAITDDSVKHAIIYPELIGSLTLKYYPNPSTGYLVDQLDFQGAVLFDDKIGLLVCHTPQELAKRQKDAAQIIRGGYSNITGYQPINLQNVIQMLTNNGFTIEFRTGLPDFMQTNIKTI